MNKFKFTKHAIKQLKDRGIGLDEVEKTILSVKWKRAKYNRFSAVQTFEFNQFYLGAFYSRKEVLAIFKEEDDKIIVITAIARYFKD